MSAVMEAAMVEAAVVATAVVPSTVAVTVAVNQDRYASWLSRPAYVAWGARPCICSLSKQGQSGDCCACNQKISDRHFRTYLFYRVCDPFSRPRAGNLTPPAPALAIVLSACAIIDLFLRNSTHKIVIGRKPKPPICIQPAERPYRTAMGNRPAG